MNELISTLKNIIHDIKFAEGSSFHWSPANRTITYPSVTLDSNLANWSLLHEAGHAVLNHQNYQSDIELMLMEVAAWEKAKKLAKRVNIQIDEEHIQDCLDTYRDWLHQRSTCPRCGVVSLQINSKQYQCHNCSCLWQVSAARFCRPYRLTKANIKRPLSEPTALSTTFS